MGIRNKCDDQNLLTKGWYYFKWDKIYGDCYNYKKNPDGSRYYDENGWRVREDFYCESEAFGAIPTRVPSVAERRAGGVCGTDASSWIGLDWGDIPRLGMPPVSTKIYFAWDGDQKFLEVNTTVVSCH